MRVMIQYFAVLREQRGETAEIFETSCETPAAVYCELRTTYGLSVPVEALRCAVNNEFTTMDQKLRENDSVAFIAPVAGG